jgi:tetratricopeptide (TPR) repeat protein
MSGRIYPSGIDAELNCERYAEADGLYQSGRIREALRLFKRAAEADPEDSDSWFAMGSCFDRLRKPKRAEAAYLKALSLAPEKDLPALFFNIGNALYDQQRFEEAISWYAKIARGHELHARAERNRMLAESKGERGS